MINPDPSDPTPTEIRHLKNQLEALLDMKTHRSALKEGAKSWSWAKAKERLRKKRRAFDHEIVETFEDSRVPTPDDLYSRFDKVWKSEVEGGLFEVAEEKLGKWGQVGVGIALGSTALGGALGGQYTCLIYVANKRWKSYCSECVRTAKEKAKVQDDEEL